MQLRRYDYSSERPAGQLIEFLDSTLRQDAGFSVREEYPSLFGEYPGGESWLIENDGRPASHLGIVVREFRHPAYRVKIGLIGSVVTAPEFRSHGMASLLIREALTALKRRGVAVCVLWSDASEFYRPFGFFRAGHEIDFKFSFSSVAGVPDINDQVMPYQPERHAHLTWHLYQRHEVKVDRSLEEHKRLMQIPRSRTFVTEREGKVTSYIVENKGADFENYIHEWGGPILEVRRNLAWVQTRVMADRHLTLIAPAHYDLEPLRTIAVRRWEGVLGLINVLDRRAVLRAYADFLRASGESEGLGTVPEKDFDLIRKVFGAGGEMTEGGSSSPRLPFFLWGFDSI